MHPVYACSCPCSTPQPPSTQTRARPSASPSQHASSRARAHFSRCMNVRELTCPGSSAWCPVCGALAAAPPLAPPEAPSLALIAEPSQRDGVAPASAPPPLKRKDAAAVLPRLPWSTPRRSRDEALRHTCAPHVYPAGRASGGRKCRGQHVA
eukprot:250757-Chlamydomonas_euryale.AAC.22